MARHGNQRIARYRIRQPALAATEDIGKVISYAPGATVLRDGKTADLAVHAVIRVSDTVRTDAGGRVKILFNDDSSLSLGPDTVMEMSEYADAGGKSAFSVNVPAGMIRAITAKITEQNPEGFKMTSPDATVGIRGTIVTMQVRRGGAGTAAAAPEAGREGKKQATDTVAARSDEFLPPLTPLKDIALGTQTLGDSLRASLGGTGHVSGSLSSPFSSSGTFSFDVSLLGPTSGAITNGNLSYNVSFGTMTSVYNGAGTTLTPVGGDTMALTLAGGFGTAGPGGFTMNSSGGGTVVIGGGPNGITGVTGSVSGTHDLMNGPAGPLAGGVTFNVSDAISTWTDSGTGSGTLTK
ncbi:MAG: FecR family protein [Deltaproteobacteria bacterium]|jgi:hypothetical protein|nr:FecR family protein [Deltaproteobacteria bacterium]